MKLGMVSLGCPKNLVDSEVMLGIIREKSLEITNDPSEADIIIVNTCGFIESAKEESINTILQMAEYKTEGSCKYLLMTGCLGQRYAEELFENIPEVDAIVGKNSFTDIGYVLDEVMKGRRFVYLDNAGYVPNQPRMLTTPNYMAYLK
ncbi:MAG: 30S ribosomal protein S12 methylthiotransferase RimO, partial [Phascolarctobacterium sp.]|nr:30S ribosomal protein S12 methylthiotransferase RimO [Phascolarctobacterium sp.]